MKKLMIALAVVGMAIASQAASISWMLMSYDTVMDPSGTNPWTGSAILTCNETGSSAPISVSEGMVWEEGLVLDCDLNADYTFTVSGSATIGGVTYTLSGSGDGSTDSLGNGNGGVYGFSWTAAPVPEPTSGLLLLLGVAGLALRRRRA